MAVAEIIVVNLDLLEDLVVEVVLMVVQVEQGIHHLLVHLKDKMVEMEQHTTLAVVAVEVVADLVQSVLLLLLDLPVAQETAVLVFKLILIQIIIIGLVVVAVEQFKMVQLVLEMVVSVAVEAEEQLLQVLHLK